MENRKTNIIVVRHGETEWNREGRLQGQGDSPLTERGLSQAVAMGVQFSAPRDAQPRKLANCTLVG